jgi:RsiW-degrading membrane proteinase PrsW (M82 family)
MSISPVIFASPETAATVQGRPIWNIIFAIIAIIVPAFLGSKISKLSGDSDRGVVAGFALFFCFAFFRIVHARLARNQPGFLSFSLGAQFFLRGAIVSILLAMAMEQAAISFLGPNEREWKDLPIALIVGFSEEVSKLLVVVVGLNLLSSSLPQQLILEPGPDDNYSTCVRWWATVIRSPKALAMAGIATGFGFMTCENIEYFPAMFLIQDTTIYDVIPAVLFRIFFNLHPLLTGLATARLAHEVYAQTPAKSATIGRITRAILPSVLIHAVYDFGLMFSATNPQDIELDNVLIGISLVLIPMSFGLLVTTYRRLPSVASSPLLLAQTV